VSYVTEVKDQGSCGDCFAFSAATVLEYWSKKHGHPKSLSSQSIMDCTSGTHRPDVGCEGGLMEYVFEYAKKHPIALDSEMPYQEKQSICPRELLSHVKVENYKVLMIDESPTAEQEFEAILHKYGPIGIGVDSENMDNYKGGIFTADMCGKDIDHAVTIIGYTKDAWIVKNSWGPHWGENGYLYLERGANACGVAEYGVYVSNAHPINDVLDTNWQMSAV
jgi:C1A family cysteine protease